MSLLCDSIIDFSSVQGYYCLHSFVGFIQLSLFGGLSLVSDFISYYHYDRAKLAHGILSGKYAVASQKVTNC
jgi:hypothetical protein